VSWLTAAVVIPAMGISVYYLVHDLVLAVWR
jgi:hypothetical protein